MAHGPYTHGLWHGEITYVISLRVKFVKHHYWGLALAGEMAPCRMKNWTGSVIGTVTVLRLPMIAGVFVTVLQFT